MDGFCNVGSSENRSPLSVTQLKRMAKSWSQLRSFRPSQLFSPDELSSFSTVNVQRRLKTALDKVGLGDAIGGVDISFDEDRDGKYEPFWCVHIYIITSIANKKRVQHVLKEIYIADDRIPRPVKISDFNNCAYRRSYAFKIVFPRRVGYDAVKEGNGVTRKCRETSRDKLRVQERLELFIYLDQCGLANRFIFRGAKPVIRSSGVTIEETGLVLSYQAKSKNRQRIAEEIGQKVSWGFSIIKRLRCIIALDPGINTFIPSYARLARCSVFSASDFRSLIVV